ncbi:MAG: hypothetical protein OEV49_01815 [candidate division Zixibacteria bacterium]|nr:hypothetical protein [candidate division Zixibacteria bacterium]MDH3936912.1 hypothetical protein [candidate division Zixibacteria bacterium]MDH4033353.1 hypothetical protein [candidate division Zixibacteria bacterium]
MNLPDYNFLSVPLWLITALHLLTLTAHFVAMNFVFGGTMVLLFSRLENKWQQAEIRKYVKLLPSVMAATVTLGVAPLLFLQLVYGRVVYSAAIVSGWFFLFVVVAAMIAYYLLYGASFAADKPDRGFGRYLWPALVTLAYVSFAYSSIFSLAERPELIEMMYAQDQSGGAINPDIGAYLFRWLHMILGAITVGGFFVGMIGRNNDAVFQIARRAFLYGMVAAMAVGLVYLFTLGEYILALMRSVGIWALTVSIFLSLGSMHFFFKKKFLPAGLMLFVSMFGMVATRHVLRLIRLDGVFDPSTIPVDPQWSVFAIFLVCFVLAIVLITYMLRLFFSDR